MATATMIALYRRLAQGIESDIFAPCGPRTSAWRAGLTTMIQHQSAEPTRNHALDGLRAGAAISIVIYHLGLNTLQSNLFKAGHEYAGRFIGGLGPSGVELFFTLSAVVLLRPYLRS